VRFFHWDTGCWFEVNGYTGRIEKKKPKTQPKTVRAGVQKALVEFAEEEKKGFCTSVALGSWLSIQKKTSCS